MVDCSFTGKAAALHFEHTIQTLGSKCPAAVCFGCVFNIFSQQQYGCIFSPFLCEVCLQLPNHFQTTEEMCRLVSAPLLSVLHINIPSLCLVMMNVLQRMVLQSWQWSVEQKVWNRGPEAPHHHLPLKTKGVVVRRSYSSHVCLPSSVPHVNLHQTQCGSPLVLTHSLLITFACTHIHTHCVSQAEHTLVFLYSNQSLL